MTLRALLALSCLLAMPPAIAAGAASACPGERVQATAGRPVIGLVLSGGGARGAAHLGVLRVIEAYGIPVDVVVGTSMGSIVGGLYASGMALDDIQRVVDDTDWPGVLGDGPPFEEYALTRKRELRRFQLGGRLGVDASGVHLPAGLREGQNIQLLLRKLMRPVQDVRCFRDLPVPFAAVATDAESGEAVVLDRGDIVEAMRASMALPAYFTPVELDGRLLIDGGSANNMPVSLARAMGAEVVIAVDIGTPMATRERLKSLLDMTLQVSVFLARRAADEERRTLAGQDVLVTPDLQGISTLDFEEMTTAVVAGEQAARQALGGFAWRGFPPPARAPRTSAPSTLLSIRMTGDTVVTREQLDSRLRLAPGSTIDDDTIHAAITRAYGLDYFAAIDYRREPHEGGEQLLLRFRERGIGPNYLQFGLGLYDDFSGENRFSLGTSLTFTELNRLTGQLLLQASVGSDQRLSVELLQPVNDRANWFVAPAVRHDSTTLNLYLDGTTIARYREAATEASLDVGYGTAYTEWRAGYAAGRRTITREIGLPVLPDFRATTGHLRVLLEHDRQDRRDFPTRGIHARLLAEHGKPALGSDDHFRHYALRASLAGKTGDTVLEALLLAETLDAGSGITLVPPVLGGPLEMSAFVRGELIGDNAAMARLSASRSLSRGVFLETRAGVGIEAGGAWNGGPDDGASGDTHTVLSAFLGMTTPLGPLRLVGGLADGGQSALHLQLGGQF